MTDKDFFILLGVAIAIMQFLYRWWDNRDNKLIISTINGVVKSFEPTVDQHREIHALVKELKKFHDVKDDSGRPMMYVPKELIDVQKDIAFTQKEITQLQKNITENQRHILTLLEYNFGRRTVGAGVMFKEKQ